MDLSVLAFFLLLNKQKKTIILALGDVPQRDILSTNCVYETNKLR